jgi:hypothetical protein
LKEKDLIPIFFEDFKNRHEKIWRYKIPDNRYTGVKPFDVIGVYKQVSLTDQSQSIPFAFEFKLHKELYKWNCDKVLAHQLQNLEDFFELGGDSRIILGIRMTLSKKEKDKIDHPKSRIAIWVDWAVLDFLKYRSIHTHVDIKKLIQMGRTYIDGRDLL